MLLDSAHKFRLGEQLSLLAIAYKSLITVSYNNSPMDPLVHYNNG